MKQAARDALRKIEDHPALSSEPPNVDAIRSFDREATPAQLPAGVQLRPNHTAFELVVERVVDQGVPPAEEDTEWKLVATPFEHGKRVATPLGTFTERLHGAPSDDGSCPRELLELSLLEQSFRAAHSGWKVRRTSRTSHTSHTCHTSHALYLACSACPHETAVWTCA